MELSCSSNIIAQWYSPFSSSHLSMILIVFYTRIACSCCWLKHFASHCSSSIRLQDFADGNNIFYFHRWSYFPTDKDSGIISNIQIIHIMYRTKSPLFHMKNIRNSNVDFGLDYPKKLSEGLIRKTSKFTEQKYTSGEKWTRRATHFSETSKRNQCI